MNLPTHPYYFAFTILPVSTICIYWILERFQ